MSNNNKILCSTVFGISMLTVDVFPGPTVLISKIIIFPIFNSSSSFFCKYQGNSGTKTVTNFNGGWDFEWNRPTKIKLSRRTHPLICLFSRHSMTPIRVLIRLEASLLHFLDSFLMLFTNWSYGTEWVTLSLELFCCVMSSTVCSRNYSIWQIVSGLS